jgi:carboxymethylenebutenolidase
MCFDFDAVPPDVPADLAMPLLAGGAGAEMLELRSADGTRFGAAFAESPEPRGPAVVVLPDVRGLYRFYISLAERFAGAGHHAIAIDPFGRTAGTGERGEDFEYMPHVRRTTPAQVQADVAAAVELVRERTGETRVVTVGFCFGGAQSYLAAANPALGLDGVVAFYGALDGSRLGIPSPVELAPRMRGPILGLFGGADAGIPQEQIDAFDAALTDAGAEHEFVVYPGAPHSFFDRRHDEHADACEDAWRRVLGFLSGAPAPA